MAMHAGQFLEKLALRGGILVPGAPAAYVITKSLNRLEYDPAYPKNPRTFGDYVKKWRLEQCLFQKELAELLGVAEMTIVNWEKGKTHPAHRKRMKGEEIMKLREIMPSKSFS